jgi:DNA-binding MarR family transcriptional regulator
MFDLGNMPGHLIRRYHQAAVAIFHREVAEFSYDLTPVQFAALDRVQESPGIDQITLAGLIAYDRTTITGVVDRLVQKGWLEQSISVRDRRARVLHLTDEGKQVLTVIRPAVEKAQQVMLHGLSEEEEDQFLRLLKKATEHVNELSRAPLKPET